MKKYLKDFSYAIISNSISLLISALATIVVPKFISVESYGYYQLYIFYLTYIGLACLGWIDGIVLRYGGEYYNNLNKALFKIQFIIYCFIEIMVAVGFILVTCLNSIEQNKIIVFASFGLAIILALPCYFFRYLFQVADRIPSYSKNLLIEKAAYGIFIIISLLLKKDNFVYFIGADLLAKLISLVHIIYCSRDIVFGKCGRIKAGITEGKENIKVGCKLLLANNAGLFITGIVRYAIQIKWSMVVFAKVSLALNVANMIMALIRVLSIVIYPFLCRMSKDKLPKLYRIIRVYLMVPLLGLLLLYYPLRNILTLWLPEYIDSFLYLGLLFPMCIFESKTALLIETFMKTLRQEKYLLTINCITVLFSGIFTYITVFVLHNLNLSIISLVILVGIRCILFEMLLEKIMSIKLLKDVIAEIFMVSIFMFSVHFFSSIAGVLLYIVFYILYLCFQKENIKEALPYLRHI